MRLIEQFRKNVTASSKFSRDQFADILTPLGHSQHVQRHRAAMIVSRVQLVSALFAVVTPLWIVIDYFVFDWPLWAVLALIRLGSSIAFVALAWPWPNLDSIRRAMALLVCMLAIPPTFYLVSTPFLVEADLSGLGIVVAHAYSLLPFIVVAGLSVFPLTALEVLLLTVPVVVVSAIGAVQMPSFSWEIYAGNMWLLALVAGVSLVSGVSQLQYMIALVNRATHDPLTGAFTRRSGAETLDLQFRISSMHDTPLAVAFIDLDHFKSINDEFGHDAGDDALRQAAEAIRAMLRRGDMLVRWGGEEFILLLANTDCPGARKVIARLREAGLGKRPDGKPLTASIGVAERRGDETEDWPNLVEVADHRMYIAKKSGRDRAVLCCEEVIGGEEPASAA